MSSKTLRLKLNDFINSKLEKDVIYYLGFILQSIEEGAVEVEFWYENGSLLTPELDKFKKIYHLFIKKYNIKIYERSGNLSNVWYEILSVSDQNKLREHRFCSTYETIEELINCLSEFNAFYRTSLTFNSRTKYQKKDERNKNSGYRKHTMARKNENKGNTFQNKK